jgi:hypothetical protein
MTATHEVEATHEASHVIARCRFGHPVKMVEAGPDTGRCVVALSWRQRFTEQKLIDLAKRESLMQHAICCCAGKAGVDRLYGWKATRDTNWKASDDYRQALQYCLQLNGGDTEAAELSLALAMRKAEKLVEAHWGEITRLASELENRGKLAGEEITEIIDG